MDLLCAIAAHQSVRVQASHLGTGHPSAAQIDFTLANFMKACTSCRAGEVLAWGINDFGQLGNGSTFYETSPTKVVGLESVRIADIAAGGWHSLALTTEGGEYTAEYKPDDAISLYEDLSFKIMQPHPHLLSINILLRRRILFSVIFCRFDSLTAAFALLHEAMRPREAIVRYAAVMQRSLCGGEESMAGSAWATAQAQAS